MSKVFISIILIFGALVVGVFYLRPAWNDFYSLRQETANLQAISTSFDDLIQQRDLLLDAVNSLSKDDVKRIDWALPQGPKSAELLVLLEVLAARAGVGIKQIDLVGASQPRDLANQPRPGGTPLLAEKKSFNELPINLSVFGTYDSFKKFLEGLEKSLRIIDVSEISFGAPNKEEFNFSIKAKTYYQ